MRDFAGSLKACAVLLLVIVTLLVYWPVQDFDFVNYDDQGYVTGNRHVQGGLNVDGVTWAFTNMESGHWHPLTWLSHMLDHQLFLQNPAGHHWTNVILHLFNTFLLLGILQRMTGRFWRSFLVASLFALHPLNVESVAWISERKNVLSTFLWFLTFWAYRGYVLSPGIMRYALLFFTFLLGLLAKPMLVTLPFLLLLIDFWPLERLRFGEAGAVEDPPGEKAVKIRTVSLARLVAEKLPLFILVVFSIVMTIRAAKFVDTLATIDRVPLPYRFMSAALSYSNYIGKMIWPHDLAVFYPYTQSWPVWQVGGAILLLLGVSGIVLLVARRRPYLTVGWFWYLGTLVPVIGLVQAGDQAMADRYAYVPLIGLFIMLVWGVSEASAGWKYRKVMLPFLGGTVLLFSAAGAMKQLPVWQNSITLFEHALRVTRNNYIAQTNLGAALIQAGRQQEAISHYEAALRIKQKPGYQINLGVALMAAGRLDEAMTRFREVLKGQGEHEKAYNNIGVILGRQGKLSEAETYFQRALQLKPDYADAHNNMGFSLAVQGKHKESLSHYVLAVQFDPENPKPHCNLGIALIALGRDKEAALHFRQALRLSPYDLGIRKLLQSVAAEGKREAE